VSVDELRNEFDKESALLLEVVRFERLGCWKIDRRRFAEQLFCLNVIALLVEGAERDCGEAPIRNPGRAQTETKCLKS
jgi:hypothetical protein